MVELAFNASEHEPLAKLEAIPKGEYTAMITRSEVKNSRTSTGTYVELEWEIQEGEYKGRKVWQRVTYTNTSEKEEGFGRKMLTAICHAVEVMQFSDTSELHNKLAKIEVSFVLGTDGRRDSNEVTFAEKALPF